MKRQSEEMPQFDPTVLFLVLCLVALTLLGGCASLPPAVDVIVSVVTNKTDVLPPVVTPPAETVEPQTLWDAVECDWMIHGTETENQVRQAAIDEAARSGKAIRFRFRHTGTDFRFWVLWWESDKDRGKFPASHMWAPRALAAGVKRWVVDPGNADETEIVDAFKAYGDDKHQLQIVSPSASLAKRMGLDGNGVKITPPEYRK